METLPPEMIREILMRMDKRSAYMFRATCRDYNQVFLDNRAMMPRTKAKINITMVPQRFIELKFYDRNKPTRQIRIEYRPEIDVYRKVADVDHSLEDVHDFPAVDEDEAESHISEPEMQGKSVNHPEASTTNRENEYHYDLPKMWRTVWEPPTQSVIPVRDTVEVMLLLLEHLTKFIQFVGVNLLGGLQPEPCDDRLVDLLVDNLAIDVVEHMHITRLNFCFSNVARWHRYLHLARCDDLTISHSEINVTNFFSEDAVNGGLKNLRSFMWVCNSHPVGVNLGLGYLFRKDSISSVAIRDQLIDFEDVKDMITRCHRGNSTPKRTVLMNPSRRPELVDFLNSIGEQREENLSEWVLTGIDRKPKAYVQTFVWTSDSLDKVYVEISKSPNTKIV